MSRVRIVLVMSAALFVSTVLFHEYPGPWFQPFRLFVTVLHETGHALACAATGGEVDGLEIFADGSGRTLTRGGIRFLVISGGYLGSALFGGLLIFAATRPRVGRHLHQIIACLFLGMTVHLASETFTRVYMLVVAVGFAFGAGRLPTPRRQDLFLALGTMTAATALEDIYRLLAGPAEGTVGGVPMISDAQALSELVGLPAAFWALVWGSVALLFLYAVTTRAARDARARIDTPRDDSYYDGNPDVIDVST